MTSYGVTRPQWVNSSVASKHLIWDMGCNIYHCANLNNLKNDTQSHRNCDELFMSVKLVCYLCSLSADDLAQLIVKNFHISFSSTQYSLQKTICGCRCLSNRSWCQITRPSEDQRTQYWLSSFYIFIYIYILSYIAMYGTGMHIFIYLASDDQIPSWNYKRSSLLLIIIAAGEWIKLQLIVIISSTH